MRVRPLILAYAVYVPLAAALVALSRHHCSVDGVAYLRIARYYANLDLNLAVNAYWSPLLSWLLVPWHLTRADALLGAKVTNALAGALFIVAAHRLVRVLQLQGPVSWAIPIGAGLLALRWLPRAIGPDMLLAALVTEYFTRSHQMSRSLEPHHAALAGVLAGVAYLTKAYALPFFVLHHSLATFGVAAHPAGVRLGWRRMGCWLAGLATCAIIAGPWIGILTLKHGGPTFSSAGKFAHSLAGPEGTYDVIYRLAVPAQGRVTSWENPDESSYLWPRWSPVGSASGLLHQLRLFFRNGRAMINLLFDADGLGLMYMVVIAMPFLAWASGDASVQNDPWLWRWSLATVAAYLSGLFFVFAESYRYYLPLQGLLLGLVGVAATALVSSLWPGNAHATRLRSPFFWQRAMAVIIVGSCALPLVETFRTAIKRPGLDLRQMAEELRTANVKGPFATNHWHNGVIIACCLDIPCLGVPVAQASAGIMGQLQSVDARAFLLFGDGPDAHETAENLLAAGVATPLRLEAGGTVVRLYDLNSARTVPRRGEPTTSSALSGHEQRSRS